MWKVSIRHGLIAFAVLRILSTVGAWLAINGMRVGDTVGVPGYTPPHYGGYLGGQLLEPWLRSDALWYLKAAVVGYPDKQTLAFFPAFPVVTRALTWVVRDELIAGLLAANLATAIGLIVMHRLASDVLDEGRARIVVWSLALFPTSFFFVAPYAESFLLASGAAALLLVRQKRWGWAGLCVAVAALSRPFGVLLVIPMALVAWRERQASRTRWVPAVSAIAAAAGWAAFAAVKTGEPAAAISVQSLWQRDATFPLITVWRGAQAVATYWGTDYGPYMTMDVLAVAVSICVVTAAVIAAWRERDPLLIGTAGYGLAALILPLASMFPGRPLLSFPRFVLGLYPCAMSVGSPSRVVLRSVAVVSGACLVLACALFVAARPLY